MHLIAHAVAAVCFLLFLSGAADARRVALVIGNGTYAHAEKLINPANDAKAVAEALRRLRFDKVSMYTDLGAASMRQVLQSFEADANGAEIALVFYAGHGIEVDGVNYLIPSDARLATASAVEDEAIPLPRVTRAIEGTAKLRLVILDACRNNPFRAQMAADGSGRRRSLGRGLGKVEPEANELIAFAAAAGTEAADGAGANSPFTAALLRHIETPGLEVRFLFAEVRDEVVGQTGRGQTPHVYGTLGRERFYLKPPAAQQPLPAPKVADASAARVQQLEAELERLRRQGETVNRVPGPAKSARADPALAVAAGSGRPFRDRLADGSECTFCPEMVVVPAGSFTMGTSEDEIERLTRVFPWGRVRWRWEGPQRAVTISRPFAVGKLEVTRGEYAAFAAQNGVKGCQHFANGGANLQPDAWWQSPGFEQTDRHPVVCVDWSEAKAFVEWLTTRTGKSYRLLSEAEWEYAARAGSTERYFWGSDPAAYSKYVWLWSNAQRRTQPVGTKLPNAWGLHDVQGNVWEWVEDCFAEHLNDVPTDGGANRSPPACSTHVYRGGSWSFALELARLTSRGRNNGRINQAGFRVARDIGR